MRLKLYISPCPNDTFMFHALAHGLVDCEGLEFDIEYHDIEQLNSRAMAAEADVSKLSCAVLPAILKQYALLDSGAALGRGNGPLLVKRKGFEGELQLPVLFENACDTRLFFTEYCNALYDNEPIYEFFGEAWFSLELYIRIRNNTRQ